METETCDISPLNTTYPITFFSSFIFVTNSMTAFYYEYYIYSCLFGILTFTSLLFHSYPTIYTNLLDKLAIVAIVSYGTYMLFHKKIIYQKVYFALIVSTFLLCILFFYYGYFTNCFCYHPEKNISNQYHSLLHFISSLGHHGIILL